MDLLDIYSRPVEHTFTPSERNMIANHFVRKPPKVHYAFYNKKSYKEAIFTVIYDREPNAIRRSPLLNNWDIICSRKLCQEELDEMIVNFGCTHRRFTVWYYKTIEDLILADEEYGIVTPIQYVKQAILKI
jgi:hypothetical protein